MDWGLGVGINGIWFGHWNGGGDSGELGLWGGSGGGGELELGVSVRMG